MIIIIGGPGSTGCTKTAELLQSYLNCDRHYGGAIARRRAISQGFVQAGYVVPEDPNMWDLQMADLNAHRDYCFENNEDTDTYIELFLLEKALDAISEEKTMILESKVFARVINSPYLLTLIEELKKTRLDLPDTKQVSELILQNTKSFWIHADPETRTLRDLDKQGIGQSVRVILEHEPESEVPNIFVDRAREELRRRQLGNEQAYLLRYSIDDYPLFETPPVNDLYGTIIDTSEFDSPKEAVLEIFNHLQEIAPPSLLSSSIV